MSKIETFYLIRKPDDKDLSEKFPLYWQSGAGFTRLDQPEAIETYKQAKEICATLAGPTIIEEWEAHPDGQVFFRGNRK